MVAITVITRTIITIKIIRGATKDGLDFLVYSRRLVLDLSFLVMSPSYHIMRVMIR